MSAFDDVDARGADTSVEVEAGEVEPIDRRRIPQTAVRRAPPVPAEQSDRESNETSEALEAADRARSAGIERAVERLTRLKRVERRARVGTIRQLEGEIDRAIRRAEDCSHEE